MLPTPCRCRVAAAPAPGLAAMRELLARPSARSRSSEAAAGRPRAPPTSLPSSRAAAFRWQPRSAARTSSTTSPVYCGDLGLGVNPALARACARPTSLLAIGTRLSETETGGYTSTPPVPARRSSTCTRTRPSSGGVYRPQVGIVSGLPEFAAAARALEPVAADGHAARRGGGARRLRGHAELRAGARRRRRRGGRLEHLRGRLPDAIVANGAGNYTVWVHRFWQFSRYRSQLAPLSGAMGYGVPAAVAGKLVHPERPVIAFAGDGCFLMCAQELATMVANGLQVLVIVVNNGMLGDDPHAPGAPLPGARDRHRPRQPRFRRLRPQLRRYGERVEETGGFAPALERALAAGGPALLELVCDPEALTPRQSLSEARAQGERKAAS